ncbi:GntR family transcriptional regulator [Ramlibacter sp. AN1015]|uniref:GntR family transcriptional regulator n=1 Tax=Ramlibacter sp. AN1015 TaxID=3133428 RepID=UPI0030BC6960
MGVVCDAITSAIRDGKLRPGDRLREHELAERLGVSRTPVREALKRLEVQGLVTPAGDGMTVTTLSPQQVTELYTAWAELEGVAAGQAALHARPADIQMMRSICEQWRPDLTPERLGTLNHRLHQAIYAASCNMFLQRSLDAIENAVALLGLQTYTYAQRREVAGAEHMAIVDAIARRDPAAAAAAARSHIVEAEKIRFLVVGQRPPTL